jgi:hypothetical protein
LLAYGKRNNGKMYKFQGRERRGGYKEMKEPKERNICSVVFGGSCASSNKKYYT